MKTDDLIAMLATQAQPVPRYGVERRFAIASVSGLSCALVLMLLGFGLNPALLLPGSTPIFWSKFWFAAVLAVAGLAWLLRLARPGLRVGPAAWWAAAPLAALWAWSAWMLWQADPAIRAPLVLGQTWKSCAFSIAGLSFPILLCMMWALKGAAPTQLRLTGAAAGLVSGALGMLVYALHCPEWAPPFVAVWYVLGAAVVMVIGALMGNRWLRW